MRSVPIQSPIQIYLIIKPRNIIMHLNIKLKTVSSG
ncbi:hypothetical protein LPU83_pLPU83d_0382 (plasmid) [Rhizobium favelukesii]|uniref:Uncharacterized protein n=1 Tax=Rhizobium favelukesii TaxID=348824 RepID=W6RSG7_9HYPH|nr:hypothetical protein LPU83_pLPU83d_0382 [Rhizobium favelukesii]